MSSRGEYRAIYTAFGDDPDVHRLGDRAHRVLVMLKLTLPATGIGVVYPLQLAEQCNCTTKQLDAALAELETPKDGEEFGWIVREKNIVWLVNGLRYEPTLSAANVQKHRTFVHRLVAQLGDRPAIVARFKAYYAEWFPKAIERESVGNRKAGDTLSEGYAKGIDSLSVGYPKGIESHNKTDNSLTDPDHTSLSSPGAESEVETAGDADAPDIRPRPSLVETAKAVARDVPPTKGDESERARRVRPSEPAARPKPVVPRPLAHLTAQELSTRDDFLALGEKAYRVAKRRQERAERQATNGVHPAAGGDA